MIFTILVLGAIFGTSEAVVCRSNTDCGTGECCYIEPEFRVDSRRQVTLPHLHQHDTGVCERYRQMGDYCGRFEKMNGHCGCGYGTRCQWVPKPTTASPITNVGPITTSQIVKRSLPYHEGPGAYKCA